MGLDRNALRDALALLAGLIDSDQLPGAGGRQGAGSQATLGDEVQSKEVINPFSLARFVRALLQKQGRDNADAMADLRFAVKTLLTSLEWLDTQGTVVTLGDTPAVKSAAAARGDARPENRYLFSSIYGTGGMGQVWLAEDRHLNREVAVKELRPEKADNATVAARFLREARLTGQLQHPGIVPVYELGARADTQQPFYTMRLVRGRTLSDLVAAYHQKRRTGLADPLEFVELLSRFVAVCNTIAYAHSRNVLHRDLKGDNIIVGDFGEVIVLDWGLAKTLDQHDTDEPSDIQPEDTADAGLTVSGQVLGTPAYMAPEQAEGRLDLIVRCTDIYGLGGILYEILTGRPPYVGSNTLEVLTLARQGAPLQPSSLRPDVPPALEAACMKALAKDPVQRYASATELAQEVQRWQDDQRRQAEDALRRQTEILRSILDSMAEGVLVADAAGKLLLMNPTAVRMLGHPEESTLEAVGLDGTFFRADGVTPFTRDDLPLLRAIRGEELDDTELLIRPTGQAGIWVSLTARPLRDEAGAMRGSVIVLHDVSERKRVEAELLRSRERFELAVAGSQDGLWDWDLNTGEVFYSPRWKSILGYEDHEIPHRIEEWEKRLHPEERERVVAANVAHIEGTTPHYEYEYRLRHKDGSYRWILARGVALRDASGKAYRMAGSHVDITERKQTEQALRESEQRIRSMLEDRGEHAGESESPSGR